MTSDNGGGTTLSFAAVRIETCRGDRIERAFDERTVTTLSGTGVPDLLASCSLSVYKLGDEEENRIRQVASSMTGFAEVHVEFLPTDQGGRRTPICLSEDAVARYMPHFRMIDGDGTYLGVEFVDGPDDPVPPGGSTYATVRFMYERQVSYDALVEGADFEICEGGRVIGFGRVTRR